MNVYFNSWATMMKSCLIWLSMCCVISLNIKYNTKQSKNLPDSVSYLTSRQVITLLFTDKCPLKSNIVALVVFLMSLSRFEAEVWFFGVVSDPWPVRGSGLCAWGYRQQPYFSLSFSLLTLTWKISICKDIPTWWRKQRRKSHTSGLHCPKKLHNNFLAYLLQCKKLSFHNWHELVTVYLFRALNISFFPYKPMIRWSPKIIINCMIN